MITKITSIISFCVILFALTDLTEQTLTADDEESRIIKELDEILRKSVDSSTNLFDAVGSIDVAVWKRPFNKNAGVPLYMKSFGKSQVSNVSIELSKLQTRSPSTGL